jgi:hypothetical protein
MDDDDDDDDYANYYDDVVPKCSILHLHGLAVQEE